jgi:16S rRNA G966 N2-methylase RsmD
VSVTVGDRRIEVPNHNSTRPTENEVRDAVVDAGVEDVEVHVARVRARLEV